MKIKMTTLTFILLDIAIDRMHADSYLRGDLFRTPLQSKITLNLFPYSCIHYFMIGSLAFFSKFMDMFGKVAISISITFDLSRDGGGGSRQSRSNMTSGKTFTLILAKI